MLTPVDELAPLGTLALGQQDNRGCLVRSHLWLGGVPAEVRKVRVMRHIAKPRALAVILSGKRQVLKGMEKRFSSLNR